MAFCTKCGAQIPDGTKFCPGCGQKIEAAAPVGAQPAEETKQAQAPTAGSYQPSYTQQGESASAPEQHTYSAPEMHEQETQHGFSAPAQQSYQAPQQGYQATQQSYQAPQQSYQAPQQGYQAPQQSYQAPQQGYQAPQQTAYASAPKAKKPANKSLIFIIGGVALVAIIAVVLILVLGGKGGTAAADPNAGVYTAVSGEMFGMEMSVADIWSQGFTIELKDNGKCTLAIDGAKSDGKWMLAGDKLHIEGAGLTCDGTLSAGKLTLENVLDMGITLVFSKDGAASAGNAGGLDASGGLANAPVNAAAASDIQKQWNGTWYGCLYVSESTGAFADISTGRYDAYMVVEVDGEGKGQFAVYLANVQDAFALANCEAKPEGLYTIDGAVAGGEKMYAYNWMFLPMPDYPDQYVMGDVIENGDNMFDYKLFMKQWGGSWQKEIDSDFAIVPPSVESYDSAIAYGELPPVGFAPIEYEGTAASSGLGGDTQAPAEPTEPQPLSGDYGKSQADADGIVQLDALVAAVRYCDEHRSVVTYEEVYNMMGGVHGIAQVDRDIWKPGEVHSYNWVAASGEYCYINFDVAADGSETWRSMSYTMGLLG